MLRPKFFCSAAVIAMITAAAAPGQPKANLRVRELPAPHGHVDRLVFSPDGANIAAGVGSKLVVWNVNDGKMISRMQLPGASQKHPIAFAGNGAKLVWCGDRDPMVRIFDVKTGKQVHEYKQPDPFKSTRNLLRKQGRDEKFNSVFLAYSADGKRMAFQGPKYTRGAQIIDSLTGRLMVVIQAIQTSPCVSLAFSPNNKWVATRTIHGSVQLCDAVTGKILKTYQPIDFSSATHNCRVVFSPDCKFLACCGYKTKDIQIWDVRSGKQVTKISGKQYYYDPVFSPDGQSLLCQPNGSVVQLYNLIAQKAVHRFQRPGSPHCARFSPDGSKVAMISHSSGQNVARVQSIFVYNLPAHLLNPRAAHVDEVALQKLWPELSGDNQLRLDRVLQAFRAAPQPAVDLFRKRMKPVSIKDKKQIEDWIVELDANTYAQRDKAMEHLQKRAHHFRPLLALQLEQAPPGERRNRVAYVLNQIHKKKQPAEIIRQLRALALLEQMATPEAKKLLAEFARGAAGAKLTVEAQAVLERLRKK